MNKYKKKTNEQMNKQTQKQTLNDGVAYMGAYHILGSV